MNALNTNTKSNTRISMDKSVRMIGLIALVATVFVAVLGILWIGQSNGQPVGDLIGSMFALGSVQAWWYVTRAAGLTSYILLWLSMVWGMAIATKILAPAVEGSYSYEFHEFLSLLGIGFVLLHIVVLLLDRYLPFTIWQLLIPFVDSYRPLWVGLGVIGFYIFLLVTLTFYIRGSIGPVAFRRIHTVSLLGYLGVTLHGLFAGTDSALPVAKLIYAGTFLVVVFLTVYWLVMLAMNRPKKQPAIRATVFATPNRTPQQVQRKRPSAR